MIIRILIGAVLLATVCVRATPYLRLRRELPLELLGLPSNATSIRDNIDTSFSCEARNYGYYADPENDCQLFHVCMPVHFTDGGQQTFKWSFICPQETIFNQETFTCARPEDSVACEDSPLFYSLNDRFGRTTDSSQEGQPSPATPSLGEESLAPEVQQELTDIRVRSPLASSLAHNPVAVPSPDDALQSDFTPEDRSLH